MPGRNPSLRAGEAHENARCGSWQKFDESIESCKGEHGDAEMRIMFCRKYRRYVSRAHCEFFNEGESCNHHVTASYWRSIKALLQDEDRPLWDVTSIVKPFNCSLMDQLQRGPIKRRMRRGRRG